jgi:hypothetical protein
MALGKSLTGAVRVSVVTVLSSVLLTQTAGAQAASAPGGAEASRLVAKLDREMFREHLRAAGYRKRGGIGKDKSDSTSEHFRSLPHFSSSFAVRGVTYPYTMLGNPPPSGRTSRLRAVIVPLRMKFAFFGQDQTVSHDFDPTDSVNNILHSPIFQDAAFPNGIGQFGDMLQRATFWNKMDAGHRWHVKMAPPRVMRPIDIEVTPETGTLFQVGTDFFGDVLIDFLDSQALTIIQLTGIDPDEVPIFVTQNVTAQALGYHSAFSVQNDDGSETLQTMIYTSWLDPSLVDPIFADISTLNHEVGEWLNDPFINNLVPTWRYPPEADPRATCSDNPFLEVGDPEGNGPTFRDFPTVDVTLDGVTYHLQDLVMLPWFADEVPSSAYNGWYDFPATTDILAPAVYCK